MARWSEDRGYTLVLTHDRGPDRYARVALVHKRTLFGEAFNVREARAEDARRTGRAPEALGAGRMLSWRWLSAREADELLAARMRTLETLGYAVLGQGQRSATARRGRWDWLRDLVDRQLERGRDPAGEQGDDPRGGAADERRESQESDQSDQSETGADAPDEADTPTAAQRLSDAIERLGLDGGALLEGLASILGVDEAELREPSLATLAELDSDVLAMVLPVWVEHDSAEVRTIGDRWLALPPTLYEVDPEVVGRWAAGDGRMARMLAERVDAEGLALLGPEGLTALARRARDPEVRASAERWRARLR